MKRIQKGVLTVEAAFVVPIILFSLQFLLVALFYLHDRSILLGAAYETAAVGCGRTGYDTAELEKYYYTLVENETIRFSKDKIKAEVKREGDKIIVMVIAGGKIIAEMTKSQPENWIRRYKEMGN